MKLLITQFPQFPCYCRSLIANILGSSTSTVNTVRLKVSDEDPLSYNACHFETIFVVSDQRFVIFFTNSKNQGDFKINGPDSSPAQ
jgi:hypothetical protein